MRTIEITAYQFAELSDKAKQKALETLSDINFHDLRQFKILQTNHDSNSTQALLINEGSNTK